MEYLIVGKVAYLKDYSGKTEELIDLLSEQQLKEMLVEGVTKLVWGYFGEDWCPISQLLDVEEVEGEGFQRQTPEPKSTLEA